MKKLSIAVGLSFIGLLHASSLINFEAPLPPGLTPNNFIQGSPVALASEVTNQFENLGVLFTTAGGAPYAALIDLTGQAPSGVNGIGAVNSAGNVDYTQDLDIFLVVPGTTTAAVTDSISIQGDLDPIPGDVVFSAYDTNGNLVASGTQPDSSGGTYSLTATGIHEFRLHSTSGTVAYDNLMFDVPAAPPTNGSAPEPGTIGLIALGIAPLIIRSLVRRPGRVAATLERTADRGGRSGPSAQ
jgi:hypothetical protein